MKNPQDVGNAVRRGIEYVLSTQRSYILDMRTARATPTPPSTDIETLQVSARYVTQPPLNFFHRHTANEKTSTLG